MKTVSTIAKNLLAMLVIIWTIQTLYYGVYIGCFIWGIENYSGLYHGFMGGWIEFADNYLFIGEYAQAILRTMVHYPNEAVTLFILAILLDLAQWEAE